MTAGLNDSPTFMSALAQIVLEALGTEEHAAEAVMAAD